MAAEQLLVRFAEFHERLDALGKIADEAWPEGGIVWNAELLKRGASAVDLTEYLDVFSEHYDNTALIWAELIWSIKGRRGNFDEALNDQQWQAEERRNIALHLRDAQKLLEYFRPNGRREKCFFRVNRCPISLATTTFFISNRHAVKHTVFWSVD